MIKFCPQDYRICPYRIVRDSDNSTTFFVVNVPEAGQWGVGCQINIRGKLYGLSVYRETGEYGGWLHDSTNKYGLRKL